MCLKVWKCREGHDIVGMAVGTAKSKTRFRGRDSQTVTKMAAFTHHRLVTSTASNSFISTAVWVYDTSTFIINEWGPIQSILRLEECLVVFIQPMLS